MTYSLVEGRDFDGKVGSHVFQTFQGYTYFVYNI